MSFFYRAFLKGLFTLLPIAVTIYLLAWITAKTEALFGEPIRYLLGTWYFPGLGIILSVVIILLAGMALSNYLAVQFVRWFEEQMVMVPLVKAIYGPLRDIFNLFGNKNSGLKRVVLVELGPGVRSLGLLTRDNFGDLKLRTLDPETVAVFVPYSYGIGGFTVLVNKNRTQEVDIPVEKAMQMALTGWVQTGKPQ